MKKKSRDNRGPMAKLRVTKRAAGLRPYEIWIHPSNREKSRQAEIKWREPDAEWLEQQNAENGGESDG